MRFPNFIFRPGSTFPGSLLILIAVLCQGLSTSTLGAPTLVPTAPDTIVFNEDSAGIVINLDAHFTGASSYTTALTDPDGLIASQSVNVSDLTVTGKPDANGITASIKVTASDANGSVDKILSLQINAVKDAVSDTVPAFDEDTPVTIDVLANDNFENTAGFPSLVVSVEDGPTDGSVVVNSNNTITYEPDLNFYGTDSFTYTVTSNGGVEDPVGVSLTINPVNDAPVITAPAASPVVTFSDGAAALRESVTSDPIFDSTADVVDVDDDPLSITLTVSPILAEVSLLANTSGLNVVQVMSGGLPVAGSFIVTGPNPLLTPAEATEALQLLAVTVEKDTIAPGTHTISVDIDVVDHTTTPPTDLSDTASGSAAFTSVNDPPQVVEVNNPSDPPVAFTSATIDVITNSSVAPLSTARVAFLENDAAASGGSGTQLVTVTATLSGSAGGTFLPLSGVTLTSSDRVASVTGVTALDATQILLGLSYRAPASVAASGATDTMTLAINDGGSPVNATITLNVQAPLTSPNILGARGDQPAQDNQALFVFSNVTVLGNAPKTRALISGAIGGTQSDTGTGEFGSLRYTGPSLPSGLITLETDATNRVVAIVIHAPPSEATEILRQIAFEPAPNVVLTATEISFRINLLDAGGAVTSSDTTTRVRLAPVNDPPSILVATGSLPAVDDDVTPPVSIFEGIQILDPDKGGNDLLDLTMTVQASQGDRGTITSADLLPGIPGVFSFNNKTPDEIEAALLATTFTPTKDGLLPNLSQVITFRLVVEDSEGLRAVDTTTRQVVLSRNDPPEISGLPAGLSTSTRQLALFGGVTISDPESGAIGGPEPVVLTLTFEDPTLGDIPNASEAGIVRLHSGLFRVSGSPADVTTSLRALVYELDPTATPAGGEVGVQVGFTLSVIDAPGAEAQAVDTATFFTNQRIWVVDELAVGGTGTGLNEVLTHPDLADSDIIVIAPRPNALPGVIELSEQVLVNKNLAIIGPGAGLVEIRPGWTGAAMGGTGSLFVVGDDASTPVQLKLSGLTLAGGVAASRGGAVDVHLDGRLALVDCEIINCSARVAGGAIAVRGGSLIAERCLFADNATASTARVGGGAVSLETNRPIVLRNCTFSGNLQAGGGAFGGGAIYAENTVLNRDFLVAVESCTFAGNVDAAGKASSVFANVGRTRISVRNSVFADDSGQTLDTSGAAEIDSLGGNVIDGDAAASVSQGTGVGDLIFLNDSTDLRETDALLGELANNGGTVRSHALGVGSLAIGHAETGAPAIDGRSVIRDGNPDSGAFEAGTFQRILINEIGMDTPGGTATDFVEIYNPRDSQPLDPNDYKIRVAGSTASAIQIIGQPILNSGVGVAIDLGVDLADSGGTVEILDGTGAVVHEASYLNAFASGGATMPTDPNQSFVRAPEFTIGGLLPHRFVGGQALADEGLDPDDAEPDSPGLDVTGVPLDGSNAPPVARDDDLAGFDEDTVASVDVLANDIERDRLDFLKVVDLSTSISTLGAAISIAADGFSVTYDPTLSPVQELHEGEMVTDGFTYTIDDFTDDPAKDATANYDLTKATADVVLSVIGINDAPVAEDDGPFGVAESGKLAIFADEVHAGNDSFEFHPSLGAVTVAPGWLLENDDDIDNDNDNTDLEVVGIDQAGRLTGQSLCGAPVVLDVRADRGETHILYNPSESDTLDSLTAGQEVTDSFAYVIEDRHGATAIATITILVAGTNDGPTAVPDSVTATEGTVSTWDNSVLVENDLDPDLSSHDGGATISGPSDFLTVLSADSPSALGATVSVDGSGAVTYNPIGAPDIESLRRGETILDTFDYTVRDQSGVESTALVTVLVTGINDTPVADPDVAYAIDEDSLLVVPAEIGVLVNDTDIDIDARLPNDSLRVLADSLDTDTVGAQVELAVDGSFTFDPRGNSDFNSLALGESLIETFEYTVIDNSYLYAVNDTFAVAQDSPEIELPILANDAPVHDPAIEFEITVFTQGSEGGSVRFVDEANRPAGSGLLYSPLGGFVGSETFTYTVEDGLGGIDTAEVTIKVVNAALNGSLVANDDAFRVGIDTSEASLFVLANDGPLPDPGAPLTIVSATGADVAPDGLSLIYSPPAGATGTQTLEYTISGGGTATATAEVEVELVALSLLTQPDTFSLVSNGQILDVLANDGPRPGSPGLSVASLSGADAADFEIRDGGVAHTGTLPLAGPKTFSYTATDPAGATSPLTNVEVLPAAASFDANDDHFVVGTVDSAASPGYLLEVLANDLAIPAGASLTITGIGLDGNLPDHGLASIEGGAIRYRPDPGSDQDDVFTYEIGIPGSLERRKATVSVAVEDLRSTLAPNDDRFTVSIDSVETRLDVLANDLPLPATGAAWMVEPLFETEPVHGIASVSADGAAILYTPDPGFVGLDALTYKTRDGLGGTGTASVVIEVGDLPLNSDLFVVLEDSTANDLPVLSNDNIFPEDASGYDLISATASDGDASVVVVDGVSMVRYTPDPGFVGFAIISYSVEDDTQRIFESTATVEVIDRDGDRATGLVHVRVDGLNDAPEIAGTGSSAINDNLAAGLPPFTGVVISDPDAGGEQNLRVTITLDDPQKGVLIGTFAERSGGRYTLEGTPAEITAALQALVFEPAENVIVVDETNPLSIEISVDDGFVTTPVLDTATVIQITAINDAPSITGTAAGLTLYLHAQLRPFVGVTISDPDDQQLQTLDVSVQIDDPLKGGLGNLGGFAEGTPGVYSMTGTAAQVTDAIRGLIFTPTPGDRVRPGFPEVASFIITVDDRFSAPQIDGDTSVIVLPSSVDQVWASDGESGAEFGAAVSVNGDWMAVGAPLDEQIDSKSGAVYLFHRDPVVPESWSQVTKVVANDGRKYAEFGRSVSLSGDLLLVGAPFDKSTADAAGAAYIFQRDMNGINAWGQVARLSASGVDKDDLFGTSVALSGSTAVVGSPDDEGPNGSGAAYIFEMDEGAAGAWGNTEKLKASDADRDDAFGTSVAIDGDRVLVGSPGDDSLGGESGSAYLFERGAGNWPQVRKILAPDGASGAAFGEAVAVSEDRILVGAPEDDALGNGSGAAYIFARDPASGNWNQQIKLTAFDGREGDRFGSDVALWDDRAVVGAPHDGHLFDNRSNESKFGSAYVYEEDQGGAGNWGLEEKLISTTAANNDEYAFSVAVHLDTVVIGSRFSHALAGSCDGGVIQLTLLYEGASAVQVEVLDSRGDTVFDGLVEPGALFTFNGIQRDYKLGSSIDLLVSGDLHASLHTSCSRSIEPGTTAGDFVVLEGLSRDGGLLLASGEPDRGRPGAVFVSRFKFNNAPLAAQASPDSAVATEERSFTYQMPSGAIGDPDVGDPLVFSATGAGGTALPDWLDFDPLSQTLTGTPGEGDLGDITLEIRAQDENGAEAFYQLVVTVESGGPFLEIGTVTGVTNTAWTTVTLGRSYGGMVVVATPIYGSSSPPLITRVQNAAGNQFELRVVRADGDNSPVTGISVQYSALEEGVYTEEIHGIKMEAKRVVSTETDSSSSWVGEQQTYDNVYDSPVVFGQVISAFDAAPSTFWARGATASEPPSTSELWVGKHVGEDPIVNRVDEIIGYVVVEEGSGRIRTPQGMRGFFAGRTTAPFLRELSPVEPLDFSALAVSSHGITGEDNGEATVLDGGRTLLLTEDAWKSVALSGAVSPATMLEFDFLSTVQGEIHAVGFDNDSSLSPSRGFQLYGSESWGIQDFHNYSGGSAFQHYRIPAGSFAGVGGAYDRLVLAADHDALPQDGHSFFTNVTLREGTLRGFAYDLPLVDPTVAVLSKSGMAETDGGWPVLYQDQGLGASGFGIAVDEDQLGDAERVHLPEGVAYMVFGTPDGSIPAVNPIDMASGFGRWSVERYGAEVVGDRSLADTFWGMHADADGDGITNLMDYATGFSEFQHPGVLRVERLASGDTRLTYHRRSDDPSLQFSLEANLTMRGSWARMAVSALEESVEPVSEQYERVEVDVARAMLNRAFFRLKTEYRAPNSVQN